jgi:transcriptional regulator with XRE-family HTH domain
MDKAGFTPSDLARAAWGSTTNKRGNSVARKRDRVGHYLAGTNYPTPENLQLLADALGIPVETLMIDRPAGAPAGAPKAPRAASSTASAGTLSQTSLPAQPSKIRLQVDRVIHWRLAEHIHRLLKEAETGEVTTVDETTLGEIVGGTDTEAQADISDAK